MKILFEGDCAESMHRNGEKMNRSIIRYILGCVLKIEAAFMLLPCIVAIFYREKQGFAFSAE